MTRDARNRWTALGAMLLVAAALGYVVLRGEDYTLRAQFANAGQVVKGGEVQVRGIKVGSIDDIDLTPEGRAEITLKITDDDVLPLREGTRAAIRAVGQAGVSNRFIDLQPGDGDRVLDDGAVLGPRQTSGIVDLDAVLNAFDPAARRDLQALVGRSREIFAGSTAPTFNRLLGRLDPALSETESLASEVSADGDALQRVIRDGATATQALASRREDLRQGVVEVSRTFAALAAERGAIGAMLRRAPTLLRAGERTLTDAADTLETARPALRAAPSAARAAEETLRALPTTLRAVRGPAAELEAQIPDLRASFAAMPRQLPAIRTAIARTGTASAALQPIVRGLRIYGTDLVLGIFNGLAGLATGNQNATGGYVRLQFTQNPQTLLGGQLGSLLSQQPLVPGLFSTKYKQKRRCPGTGAPPARDGSSPYIPDPTLCDPSQGMSADVNEP
ncbi:MlaD family protein [Paraconexibacter algicola]|uniref:Mce/MlaD domain-containing protein n=1 Tax=Paraconexibacter algicola TaxID=2133960 RepID=A0A2T4UL16_9ACTN|nr:MlaD family protein [Paraconexibacter algicola]PTL59944.1 hypothetical protein C7Y72_09955 [Paraconexibacter algicola]